MLDLRAHVALADDIPVRTAGELSENEDLSLAVAERYHNSGRLIRTRRSYDCRVGEILVWAGRAEEAMPWLEGAARFDRAHSLTSQDLCIAYYFLGRYREAVEAGDRALARSPGRSIQTERHPFLAAAYAQIGRDQDAEGERVIVTHLSPFFDPRRFAAQFGTQETRDHILEGLKKAGFR
jgi:tetratricopeptide (TPR) repeat protein